MHNGKLSLDDYDVDNMQPWEIEKAKKAIAKRKRRDSRDAEK